MSDNHKPAAFPSGLTVAMLQRVTQAAYNDHVVIAGECDCRDEDNMRVGEPCAEWCASERKLDAPLLAPAAIVITAINPPSDSAFDRCSHARWANEPIIWNGETFRIVDYFGSGACPWRLRPYSDHEGTGNTYAPLTEWELSELLTRQNGAHPNPYIASVECTYDIGGHRALYGIRADGTLALWAD